MLSRLRSGKTILERRARRQGRQRKMSVQGSMGRQYLLNNNEVRPTKSMSCCLQAISCSNIKARITAESDSFLKRLSLICKSTWRPAGTRAADCIEGWAHKL